MVAFLSAGAVAVRALEKIGAFTTNDVGADPVELARAMDRFDAVIGHYMTTSQFRFLVPATFTLALVAEQGDYDLRNELGAVWPADGLVFVNEETVSLIDDAGNKSPIEMVRRDEWEKLDIEDTGSPAKVYFDRSDTRTIVLRTNPVLGAGTPPVWSISFTAQKIAKTVDSGVNPTIATGLPSFWNLWAEYALAYAIGDGPVRKVSATDLVRWGKDRDTLFADLMKFANREHADDTVCEPWGGVNA